MNQLTGFSASDAERQTADSAANYFNRGLRMIAERFSLEKTLERDPAAFAILFAPLLSSLIEAQAREYQSFVFSERLESLDESLLGGLADLAEHWEEMNAQICRSCARKAGSAYRQAKRETSEAAENGE
jgi:hypothetical protein